MVSVDSFTLRFEVLPHGGDEEIRLSRELRAQSFAALTVHRTVIHYRSYFESRRRINNHKSNTRLDF